MEITFKIGSTREITELERDNILMIADLTLRHDNLMVVLLRIMSNKLHILEDDILFNTKK